MNPMRAAVAAMAGRGVAGLVRLVAPMLLLGALGESYGPIVACLSAATLIFAVGNLGWPQASLQLSSTGAFDPSDVASASMRLGAAVAGACVVGLVLVDATVGVPPWALPLAVLPSILVVERALTAALVGTGRPGWSGVAMIAHEAGPATVALSLALGGADWPTVLWGWTAGAAIVAAATLGFTWRLGGRRTARPEWRAVFLEAWPRYVSTLLATASYRSDILLLHWLAAPIVAAQYAVAVGVAESTWLLSTVAAELLTARVARSVSAREAATNYVCRTVLAGSVLIAVVLTVAAPLLAEVVGVTDATTALALAAWSAAALAASRVLASHMAAVGRPKVNIPGSTVAFAFNIGLNLVMIPRWGATGAALASLVSYTVTLAFRTVNHRRLTGATLSEMFLARPEDASAALRMMRSV